MAYTRVSHGSPGNDSSSTDATVVINAIEAGLEAVEAAYVSSTTLNAREGGVTTGLDLFDRRMAQASMALGASGTMRAMFFTPDVSFTAANITVQTGATAAAATPTLCRMALYSVDASNRFTAELANTANDTTLFATTFTAYTRALSQTVSLVQGTRYAVGILVVSATTMPNFAGVTSLVVSSQPWIAAASSTIADLPGAFPYTMGSGAAGGQFWCRLT